MKLRIGRRGTWDVASLAEASQTYERIRDESGEGGSTFPDGRLTDGRTRYRISYNGRIWEGPWFSGQIPVYDNRTE